MPDIAVDDKLTEIAVVLDRSGSMSDIKDDMEGGLWEMITEQHGMPGKCRVSLYQFDTQWETVFEARPSGEIQRGDCRLVPRGGTALNDAVVKSLSALEDRILKEPEGERPKLVFVVVITDGHENSSTENKTADVRKAIERATEKLGWQFAFLAADPKGFAEGGAMTRGTSGSVGQYAGTSKGARGMSKRYSAAVRRVRSGSAKGIDVSKPHEDE